MRPPVERARAHVALLPVPEQDRGATSGATGDEDDVA